MLSIYVKYNVHFALPENLPLLLSKFTKIKNVSNILLKELNDIKITIWKIMVLK